MRKRPIQQIEDDAMIPRVSRQPSYSSRYCTIVVRRYSNTVNKKHDYFFRPRTHRSEITKYSTVLRSYFELLFYLLIQFPLKALLKFSILPFLRLNPTTVEKEARGELLSVQTKNEKALSPIVIA